MANAEISPGIYHIIEAKLGEIGPNRLTRYEGYVTILPPGDDVPEADQEWRVLPAKDGNVIIERSNIRPGTYLTYHGASSEKPEEGDRVEAHLFEFPPNEWHVGIASGFRNTLQLAGTNLGIRLGPQPISPPFLELGDERQLYWVFRRIRPDSD